MTDAPPQNPEAEGKPPAKPTKRPGRALRTTAIVLAALAVLLVGVGLVVRYGVLTDVGRRLVVQVADGLSLGRFGRLEVSGLNGDVFGRLTVERVAVVDRDGVWIEGRDVAVAWRPAALLGRRFHAERVTAGRVIAHRPPHPEPPSGRPEQPLPVSIAVDAARLRVETLPELTQRRGLYDVAGSIDMARSGPYVGKLNAVSLLRRGDGVDAEFRVKDRDRFRVHARAVEADGGAIAGGLGLAPDRPFRLDLRADGDKAGGELFLLALSGADRPAEATGRWTKAGGQVQGRLALGASRLTRLLAQYFGPELTFTATARQTTETVYATRVDARADNMNFTAAGPVDSRRRASVDGLRVAGTIHDVSRVVTFPEFGPATLEGVLKGGLSAFVVEGTGRVEGVATPQYRLTRAAGPVRIELKKGDVLVDADLATVGGGGERLYATLLGPSPRVAAKVTRLRDGRTLIRSLTVRGPGVSVDGEGTRGVFGDLAFKGRADITNLAAAAPGASGALSGAWTARQTRPGQPWTFDFDGRGARFGSGVPELDRLLGPAPRLTLAGAYLPSGDTRIDRSALDGAAADGRATGFLRKGGVLDFDVDWSAQGPFGFGPVEVAGRASGDGALAGTIAAPRAELTAAFDAIDFGQLVVTPAQLTLTFLTTPDGIDGRFALTGGSTYGPASAGAAFRYVQNGIDLTDAALDAGGVKANGALALRDGAPSSADLTFSAGPGAFLARGRASGAVKLVDAGGGRATVSLTGEDLGLRAAPDTPIERVRLTADGPLTRLPFQLSIAAPKPQPVSFDGSGVFAQAGPETTVTLEGRGKARDVAFSTVEPILVRVAEASRSVRARLAVGGGEVAVDGRQAGDTVTALATLQGVDIATLSADFSGRVTARVNLAGDGARLTGDLTADLDDARSLDAPRELAVDGRVRATLDDSRLRLTASATNAAGLRAETELDLPAEASAQPFRLAVNRTQPIRGRFDAEGELRSLWDLFFGAERTLSGRLDASGTIAGTLNSPRASGSANVTGGRFRDAATGLELRNLTLAADLADTAVIVRQLTANDGGKGALAGQGRIGLTNGAASTLQVDLTRFQFLDSDLGEATASGRIEVVRDARGENAVSGALRVDAAEIVAKTPNEAGIVIIEVVEVNRPGGTGVRAQPLGGGGGARGPAVKLDVAVTAPRGVFIRGQGVDLEVALDARVRGTTLAPELSGVARVYRGTYEFAGKRFEFDDRGTVRLATDPKAIRLDLTAVRDDPALTARVRVTGTAAEPIVTLSSTPQLPQDEILSQVLFGRSASQLTPIEAAQLAAALASLATGGGFDVMGNLRSFAGLDRLALGGGAAGTTIAGGKYLTEDVYLELIGGAREGPQAEVEWRVRRNLSLVSRVGGETGARLSVRYRRSF